MNKRKLWKSNPEIKNTGRKRARTYPRPSWVKGGEEELCPECFKAVGERSRYQLICMLGREKGGLTVAKMTARMDLQQPTVTHHLNVLRSVDAVTSVAVGRERIYKLNRGAHCFEECKIPYA